MDDNKTNRQIEAGKILVSDGKLPEKVYKRAVKESEKQGKPFLELLLSLQEVSEEDVTIALSKVLDYPYIHLQAQEIITGTLNMIPKNAAENFHIIAFDRTSAELKVAMIDPEDFKAIETVEFLARRYNLNPVLYITSRSSFESAFRKYETLKTEVGEYIEKAEIEYAEGEPEEQLSGEDIEKIVTEAPISKAVDVILSHAVEGRASDVHVEPLEKETRVRYRVDGVMHVSLILPKKIHPAIVARIKVLSNLKIDERRKPQDGRFQVKINRKGVDVRVSTLPVSTGEKVVMRILDTTKGALELEDLGLDGRALEIVNESIKEPYGMFLVTGPTGSGKSTTLYSSLNILNREEVNIVTMEDPVEYYIEGVNQSQINPQIGLTFANGLRSILRQDPDVIMVGEIRDGETAEMAIHSALTGHFLLSTLHTNTAIGAIPRLIDMGMERFLLTATLNVLLAQRLVRRICDHCKETHDVPEQVLIKIKEIYTSMPERVKKTVDIENPTFYRGRGCSRCGQKGYQGRVGIFEVLAVDESIKQAIMLKKSINEIAEIAKEKQDMITMEQDGVLKVLAGKTTVEEIIRVV
ncbi:GspE/PulE family protein [Patescibacteria group bacterium]|nr:GspE/PulE family protein [Patescibacteria group bacterium]